MAPTSQTPGRRSRDGRASARPNNEDQPLPDHIRKALDAVVNGPGRIATAAHPDCICGKPLPNEPLRLGRRHDCPQHGPKKLS